MGSFIVPSEPASSSNHESSANKNPSLRDLDTDSSLKSLINLGGFLDIECEDNNNNDGGDHVNQIQSPDWENIFSDQLEGDFMVCSPLRNTNYVDHAHASSSVHGNFSTTSPLDFSQSLLSSPRRNLHKGKGLSPVQKVLNSPDNQFTRVDHIESFSLPPLETLLDDSYIYKDDDLAMFSPMKKVSSQGQGGENQGSTNQYWFDTQTVMAPEFLECFMTPESSRFSGSTVSGQESGIYQMESDAPTLLLSQHPIEERLRDEKQKQQQTQQIQQLRNTHNTLMVPMMESEQETDNGLQLVHLLLACAEAVSKQDYMLARKYIYHLTQVVSPLGDSMQRVAACFTEALSARLAATLMSGEPSALKLKRFNPFPPENHEILKIYQTLYQACPYIKFAHFTANQAIFEAFEGEGRVHVIDLDILQGYQWPAFMQALAARPGGAPFLRITGVGPTHESVIETGRCLTELAQSLNVPFEFHPVGQELEDLKPHMVNRRVGEALAVNSVNRLHRVPSSCLGNLLTTIRDQAPKIVTIVEQEASHNGPYFLGRFLEALHYYSAIFDSLDATFPPESPQRAKVEQQIFGPVIMNIVAQEGPERVMRHERLEKWRKIMEGKGFRGIPLSPNAVTQSTILLGLYSCDGYRLTEDKGCLLLGWQDRAIIAASAWRC